jgi:hypothetical protein
MFCIIIRVIENHNEMDGIEDIRNCIVNGW